MIQKIKAIIPQRIFQLLQSPYHYGLALLGVLWYGFPSQKLIVVGVTGTKGKSTTVELVNAILEEAGFTTAVAGTVRFKVAGVSERNLYKMTMPGRFFMQQFLRRAVNANCTHAIIEMTSEGVKQFRHTFIDLDALIFTNLAPEHIESHGSFEKYAASKLKIATALARSPKHRRIVVANTDDAYGEKFFTAAGGAEKIPFGLKDAEPYTLQEDGIDFTFRGTPMHSLLIGTFNLYNILAAMIFAESQNIATEVMGRAISKINRIPGRVEKINEGQAFSVIVDYAHTPDSLKALFDAFPKQRKICVFGATGGGRDKWKRPEMGKIGDQYCDVSVLNSDDPYEEDPLAIIEDVARGFKVHTPEKMVDRRAAIRRALSLAKQGDVVLITGKGTDPYLMESGGRKTPWSDAGVVREELSRLLNRDSKKS